jgi:hypothetical protein
MFDPRYWACLLAVAPVIPVASKDIVVGSIELDENPVGVLCATPTSSTKFVNVPVGKVGVGPVLISTGKY